MTPDASDGQIVKLAWQLQYIIVTANGDDFVKEIDLFQRNMTYKSCHDLFGLLVVPDGAIAQVRTLRDLTERLRFGGRRVSWEEVMDRNLYVRAKNRGPLEIRPFRRCLYCKKLELGSL